MALTFNDDALAALKKQAALRLARAGAYFHNFLTDKLGVSSPHESRRRTRDTAAGKKGSSYLVYTDPAKAGEFPKLRTGQGQASVAMEPIQPADVVKEMNVKLGLRPIMSAWQGITNYLWILESLRRYLGFGKTMEDTRAAIKIILETPA